MKTNKIKTIAIICIAFFLGLFLFFQMFLVRVKIGQVGVRLQQYSLLGKKGVQPQDYGPGWHRSIPMLDSWTFFDSTVQTTEFTSPEDRRRLANWNNFVFRKAEYEHSSVPVTGPERIELKSKDGYTVQMDVTVKYRIEKEKAHMLYQDSGSEVRYKGLVRDQAQNVIRNAFGNMKTEEFYKPEVRREWSEKAYQRLKENLQDRYVKVIGILVRDISFDPAYERKILDKKLADQNVELNKSRGRREEKKGETEKIKATTEAIVMVIEQEKKSELVRMRADTDKQIAEIEAEARLKVNRLKADADRYAAEKDAEGSLLEKESEAQGEQLKATALIGSGGTNLVAREAAGMLNITDTAISTLDINFLDVDAMVERLGAKSQ